VTGKKNPFINTNGDDSPTRTNLTLKTDILVMKNTQTNVCFREDRTHAFAKIEPSNLEGRSLFGQP